MASRPDNDNAVPKGIRMLSEHYKRIRATHPTLMASQAIRWARHEVAVDEFLSTHEFVGPNDRDWPRDAWPLLAGVVIVPGGRIDIVWDDEVFDWGDIEPTESERENLRVIGLRALDIDGDELESVWGYGYTSDDDEREWASFAIELCAVRTIQREADERARWAARDVETAR